MERARQRVRRFLPPNLQRDLHTYFQQTLHHKRLEEAHCTGLPASTNAAAAAGDASGCQDDISRTPESVPIRSWEDLEKLPFNQSIPSISLDPLFANGKIDGPDPKTEFRTDLAQQFNNDPSQINWGKLMSSTLLGCSRTTRQIRLQDDVPYTPFEHIKWLKRGAIGERGFIIENEAPNKIFLMLLKWSHRHGHDRSCSLSQ